MHSSKRGVKALQQPCHFLHVSRPSPPGWFEWRVRWPASLATHDDTPRARDRRQWLCRYVSTLLTYTGSAVCKQAIARGWNVVSISGSGRPFRTQRGHAPAWTESPRMQWRKADAFDPATYRDIAAECTAAVHTMGILLESAYKGEKGSTGGALAGLAKGWGLSSDANPLAEDGHGGSLTYERMNRDAALLVAQTFKDVQSQAQRSHVPFVYLSAEDIMRPLISSRYISTKYEAEQSITAMADDVLRPILMRPGLMYHPHHRPWTTVPATMLDASCHLHKLRTKLKLPIPLPADLLQSSWAPTALRPLAGALVTPPLHVDTVGVAICEAIENPAIYGVQATASIRQLAGWPSETEAP